MKKIIKILLVATLLLAITTGYSQPSGVQITISPSPTLYSVTGGGAYCAGLSGVPVGLSGSEIGVNYQLQINGINYGMPIPGTGGPLNFGNQLMSGTYTVIGTSASTGCSIQMSNSATVMVNPIPSITLSTSGPVEFCGSGTVTITANAGSNCTYQWKKNGVIIPGANLNQYVANSTGMYTVIATNTSTGCFNDHDTMVQVHPLPQLFTVSTSSPTFCEGSNGVTITQNGSQVGASYQLLANGANSSVPVAGTGFALSWYNQATAGTYTVVATDNTTGCTSIMNGSCVVAMDPLPNTAGPITGPTSVCQGSTATFITASIANATSYIWSVPNGATIVSGQGTTQITVSFSGSTSGNISVFGQNSCGGGQPSILPINVNPTPILTITANPTGICAGNSTTLTASGTGTSFLWSTGATTQIVTVSPISTTTYSVTATGANTCTTTGNVTVTVHSLPTVSINGLPNSVCTDQNTVTLSGTPSGGTWSGFAVGGNLFYPPVAGPGTYPITYTVTDQWGCTGSAVNYITVNPVPVVNFISPPGPIYVTTPAFDMMQFVYPPNGTFTGQGMVGSIFNPATAGVGTHMITYKYTNPVTGCSSSQIQYVQVGAVGIDEITAAVNAVNIFPNPAHNILHITRITGELKSLRIVDMIGQVVYTSEINNDNIQIDVSGFNSGTYIISFMNAEGLSVGKWFMKTE